MPIVRLASRLLATTCTLTLSTLANAAEPPAPPRPPSSPIQPTVTQEMGDRGGKFMGHAPDPAKTKHYYIAAEPILWNFAPEGTDPVCGKAFPPSLLLNRNSWKIRYVQYADANFSARILPAERLGILGPVLRGTTGQYLAVTFLNRAWLPLSMHPHGVKYDKDSEGSYYQPAPGLGAAVAPGAKFTYVWYLDQSSAPLPTEPSSRAWLYHSHTSSDAEANLGLIGSIIVTDPARARADGTPRDVDREMAALFMIFDESGANLGTEDADEQAAPVTAANPADPAAPVEAPAPDAEMIEASQRHTINGLTFGNLTGLEMNEGERVRWYLFGLGSESDLHSAHWHGARLIENAARRTDTVELLPGSMKVADMIADDPGQWLLHCHVTDHMARGMFARFTVHAKGVDETSRAPATAFFGLPESWQTLRWKKAELEFDQKTPEAAQLALTGEVTVPDPFPIATHPFTVHLGRKTLALHPDASGLSVTPAGILLVTNATSFGVVKGGTLNFELTLKGASWPAELSHLHLAPQDTFPISLEVGEAQHTGLAALTHPAR